jgi:hypothetical protein
MLALIMEKHLTAAWHQPKATHFLVQRIVEIIDIVINPEE